MSGGEGTHWLFLGPRTTTPPTKDISVVVATRGLQRMLAAFVVAGSSFWRAYGMSPRWISGAQDVHPLCCHPWPIRARRCELKCTVPCVTRVVHAYSAPERVLVRICSRSHLSLCTVVRMCMVLCTPPVHCTMCTLPLTCAVHDASDSRSICV